MYIRGVHHVAHYHQTLLMSVGILVPATSLTHQQIVEESKGRLTVSYDELLHRPHPFSNSSSVYDVKLPHEVQGCKTPIDSAQAEVLSDMCFQGVFGLHRSQQGIGVCQFVTNLPVPCKPYVTQLRMRLQPAQLTSATFLM